MFTGEKKQSWVEERAQQERSGNFLLGGEQGINISRTQGSVVPGPLGGRQEPSCTAALRRGPGNRPPPPHRQEWLTPVKLYSMQTNCPLGKAGGGLRFAQGTW